MKKAVWMIPVAIAFGVYFVGINNFFVYDDFIWLYRAKTLAQNWHQMFSVDVIYFDPLVYLMFWVHSYVGGLDPRWYHVVDLAIHALNSVLVFRLASLLSSDEKASLYGSILFASSFAIADAVLWPSSRVDLVSVMFSLGTLILFIKYLRTNNIRLLGSACLFFTLALGAKGTPAVLPFILLWMLYSERQPLRRFTSLFPFLLLVILYLVLVQIALQGAANPLSRFNINIWNGSLALCGLFIPEWQTEALNPYITSILLAFLVIALGFLKFSSEPLYRLRRTGLVILATGLLPVLILKDFKLATYDNPITLLSSPSHRIYLSSVGLAVMGGGFLRSLELIIRRHSAKIANLVICLLFLVILIANAVEVRQRSLIWERTADKIQSGLYGLLAHQDKIVEDGFVGLVNFPGAQGFLNPMIETYFHLDHITTGTTRKLGIITDPQILKRAEISSFFVLGRGHKVYDLSDQFRAFLLLCRQAALNPAISDYKMQIQTRSTQINWQILQLLPEDAEF